MELLVCMLCSITCGVLAKIKNRNVIYWSIGGLFGCVLSIVILLALDKLDDKSENKLENRDLYSLRITKTPEDIFEEEERERQFRTCPICGHENVLNQKLTKSTYYNEYVCQECGTEWNIKVK